MHPGQPPVPSERRVRYDQLGRAADPRWWRPVAGAAVLLCAFGLLAIGSFAVFAGLTAVFDVASAPVDSTAIYVDPLWDTAALLALVGCFVPAALLATRATGRAAGTVWSVTGRLRLRWLGWCALLALPAILAELAGLVLLDPAGLAPPGGSWVGLADMAAATAVLVLLVPLQSAGEEILARGWLPQAVGSWTRSPWPGFAAGAVLWTALHVPSTWSGVATLLVFSAVTAMLTLRTGGLEAAVALHTVGNVLAFLAAAALGQLADDSTAGDAGWQLVVVDAVVLPAYAAAVLAMHRRLGLSGTGAPSRLPAAAGTP